MKIKKDTILLVSAILIVSLLLLFFTNINSQLNILGTSDININECEIARNEQGNAYTSFSQIQSDVGFTDSEMEQFKKDMQLKKMGDFVYVCLQPESVKVEINE